MTFGRWGIESASVLKQMNNFRQRKEPGKAMTCPKCKSKIGVLKQQIFTESGKVFGMLCYICGYWKQEFPKP